MATMFAGSLECMRSYRIAVACSFRIRLPLVAGMIPGLLFVKVLSDGCSSALYIIAGF